MTSHLIVHIDDYGVTENYSKDVLKAVEKKVVNAISILPNGYFTNQSLELIKSHNVEISVHLNLVEGIPLSRNVPLLLNSLGEFKLGFLNLFLTPLLSSNENVLQFRTQIKNEFKLQIEKIRDGLSEKTPLSLDSHRHIHLIPFVFDIVLELAEEYKLTKIRIIDEPFYIYFSPLKNIKAYLNGNIIKHFIINFLSNKAKKKLILKGKTQFMEVNEKFLGILFSDLMSVSNVSHGLSQLQGYKVRVLFHSGVKLSEENYIGTNKTFLNYYESKARKDEKFEILSHEFQTLYKKINQNEK